ncbi:Pyrroline-5-carboxylate reductase [Limihaloglobus sulfuriphilus]|uniref:Pyrroline-5-carboxylate reductase n=1 Tax=Limihaloglobus sulfuriphilus TaxID=1851148 RepID=A0A1Q2MDU5_9BACT|nr:pyrroline-5-carboxylate reductase [Limihaloglobus sulfuriphilus]AQQ70819.1 Pyrroline-5-carboxylate reductase [Limihaloglobus sulfuriphilus]
MYKAGFIGGGNMAEAIVKGVLKKKIYKPNEIIVTDISSQRLDCFSRDYGVDVSHDNCEASSQCQILFLCTKPQSMRGVLNGIAGNISESALIVSIAAGIRIDFIEEILGSFPVIRVMPNTPALCGAGAAGIYANKAAQKEAANLEAVFNSIGKAVVVETEDEIDIVTALSGSGPAYFFLMMEEMIASAQELGLDYDSAKTLTLQTAFGAAMLALESDKEGVTPARLREQVTSPGGTTEAALKVFQRDQFGAIVLMAMEIARERSKELSGK